MATPMRDPTTRQYATRRARTHRPDGAPQTTGRTHYVATPVVADIIGSAGEKAFSVRYRLPMPTIDPTGKGDGGVDFKTPIGNVSVKTSPKEKARNLLVFPKELKGLAPWIVFAEYDHSTDTATLVGWTTSTIVRLAPWADFGLGCEPYVPRAHLAPMNHLAFGGLIDYAPDTVCCDVHHNPKEV